MLWKAGLTNLIALFCFFVCLLAFVGVGVVVFLKVFFKVFVQLVKSLEIIYFGLSFYLFIWSTLLIHNKLVGTGVGKTNFSIRNHTILFYQEIFRKSVCLPACLPACLSRFCSVPLNSFTLLVTLSCTIQYISFFAPYFFFNTLRITQFIFSPHV